MKYCHNLGQIKNSLYAILMQGTRGYQQTSFNIFQNNFVVVDVTIGSDAVVCIVFPDGFSFQNTLRVRG